MTRETKETKETRKTRETREMRPGEWVLVLATLEERKDDLGKTKKQGDNPCRGWLGKGSNELGRGINDLGRGSNDLGRGSIDLGRGMLKCKLSYP